MGTFTSHPQPFQEMYIIFLTWLETGTYPSPVNEFKFFGPKLQTPKLFILPSDTCLFSSVIASSVFSIKLGK